MSDIFGSSSNVPRWLEAAAQPLSGEKLGRDIGTSLADLYTSLQKNPEAPADASWGDSRKGLAQAIFERNAAAQDPLWKEKWGLQKQAAWMNYDMANTKLDLAKAELDAKNRVAQDEAADNALYSQTIATVGTDSSKIADMPMPAFKSNKYRMDWQTAVNASKLSAAYREREAARAEAKAQSLKDHADFLKQLSSLQDPIARTQIQQMNDPVMQQKALAIAQAADRQKAQNATALAEAEAAARGDTPLATIGPKGVTKTYKPGMVDQRPVVESQQVDGQNVWYIRNPKTGHFQILNNQDAIQANSLVTKLTGIDAQVAVLDAKPYKDRSMHEDSLLESLKASKTGIEAQLSSITNRSPVRIPGGTQAQPPPDRTTRVGRFLVTPGATATPGTPAPNPATAAPTNGPLPDSAVQKLIYDPKTDTFSTNNVTQPR
jgi:hypothetical protein